MLLLVMHPRAIGHRSRIVILEELISHMKSKGQRLVCHPPGRPRSTSRSAV